LHSPAVLLSVLALAACETRQGSPGPAQAATLDVRHAAAIEDSVRLFAAEVAEAVSQQGPAAWRSYFLSDPAFFMAAEGRLVFPNSDSAVGGIRLLTQAIAHIELRWGQPLRVDPLAGGLAMLAAPYHELRIDTAGRRVEEDGFFTGLAEHRPAGWQFRDAHWSVLTPPAAVP
jgi:hypothetical protein